MESSGRWLAVQIATTTTTAMIATGTLADDTDERNPLPS
jgi:hypothetical protein